MKISLTLLVCVLAYTMFICDSVKAKAWHKGNGQVVGGGGGGGGGKHPNDHVVGDGGKKPEDRPFQKDWGRKKYNKNKTEDRHFQKEWGMKKYNRNKTGEVTVPAVKEDPPVNDMEAGIRAIIARLIYLQLANLLSSLIVGYDPIECGPYDDVYLNLERLDLWWKHIKDEYTTGKDGADEATSTSVDEKSTDKPTDDAGRGDNNENVTQVNGDNVDGESDIEANDETGADLGITNVGS